MAKDATTGDSALREELALLRTSIESLSKTLTEFGSDLQYVKAVFEAKQAKEEKLRAEEEQARLAEEEKKEAHRLRSSYEYLVERILCRPWEIWPAPASKLSVKEMEMASLLARGETDDEIAKLMKLRRSSVAARVCVMREKLGVDSRETIGQYYLKYKQKCRDHRTRRCLWLLDWLLEPPPGRIKRNNLKLAWKRKLGRGRVFHHVGPSISARIFDDLAPYEHNFLILRLHKMENAEIARRLKLTERTVQGYYDQICNKIYQCAHVLIHSDKELARPYQRYLKQVEKRNQRRR